MKKKALVPVLSVALVLCFAAGATIAWLKDQTKEVKNTFTVGDIDIAMSETVNGELKNTDDTNSAITNDNYKIVPGATLSKDPAVIVKSGSEACWLFIKVDESDNLRNFITYTMSDVWTALDGETGVYYYNGTDLDESLTTDKTYYVLKDSKVYVKSSVTKEELNAIDTASDAAYPTLAFTAYAVQKEHLEKDGVSVMTAAEAWALAK